MWKKGFGGLTRPEMRQTCALCRAQREVAALVRGLGRHLPRLGWRSPEEELARFIRRVVPPLLEEGFAAMQSSACVPLGRALLLRSMQRSNQSLGVNLATNREKRKGGEDAVA